MEPLLAENYGVVSTAQVLVTGLPRTELRRLVNSGRLRSVRRGWFAGAGAQPEVERAVKLGGALTCVSALRMFELWAPKDWPDSRLHVRRSRHFSGHAAPRWLQECRVPGNVDTKVTRSVDSLATALACALGCLPGEAAVALMDSALNKGLISAEDLRATVKALPKEAQKWHGRVDSTAQSGTESLTRQRLRAKGIKVRSQVEIDDVGRIDFLVGDRLVIEVDSWTYHADPVTYRNDRRRDRRLVRMGYIVVRLTYAEVLFGWATVEADIMAIIREKRHLWPRKRAS